MWQNFESGKYPTCRFTRAMCRTQQVVYNQLHCCTELLYCTVAHLEYFNETKDTCSMQRPLSCAQCICHVLHIIRHCRVQPDSDGGKQQEQHITYVVQHNHDLFTQQRMGTRWERQCNYEPSSASKAAWDIRGNKYSSHLDSSESLGSHMIWKFSLISLSIAKTFSFKYLLFFQF